jgi:hypothetical protein
MIQHGTPVALLEARAQLTHRELQREKAWSRIYLVPLVLAEQDRDAYRRQQAALAREKEIMKDVDGWEVSGRVSLLSNVFRLLRAFYYGWSTWTPCPSFFRFFVQVFQEGQC